MSKWQIFLAGAEVRSTPLLWLVIFAALNSVLSLGYYAPMVNRLYRREPSETVLKGNPIAALMALPVLLLTLGTIVLGFWPSLLTWLLEPARCSLPLLRRVTLGCHIRRIDRNDEILSFLHPSHS